MTKRGFSKAAASIAALGLALALAGCPSELAPPDIGWTAGPNNTDNTTAIVFSFNSPVSRYQLASNITVAVQGGGEVITGELSGGGRLWSLPVTVIRGGTAWVSISSDGISGRPAEFQVGATNVTAAVSWRAQDSAIQLVFDNYAVGGLTADHVRISSVAGGGEATTSGDPSRINAETWLVPVNVIREGYVMVSVQKAGVSFQETDVELTLIDNLEIRFEPEENAIRISFPGYNVNLSRDQVVTQNLTANVTFGGELRRGNDGADWFLPVTVTREGTVLVWVARPGVTASGRGSAADPVEEEISPVRFYVETYEAPQGIATHPNPTTRIYIEFVAPISSLTRDNISVRSPTVGIGLTGLPLTIPANANITGSGRLWAVDVNVPAPTLLESLPPNNAWIRINMPGVVAPYYFEHEIEFTRPQPQ